MLGKSKLPMSGSVSPANALDERRASETDIKW
jgi:hypothetical protein